MVILLIACSAAYANPKPSPGWTVASVVVTAATLFVEACLASFVLAFFSLEPLPMVAVLVAGNLLLYPFVFVPLVNQNTGVLRAEVAIVLAEALLIKLASLFETFQAEGFRRLKWWSAIMASAVGNAFSFGVGKVVLP